MAEGNKHPAGGNGGSVEIAGESGVAEGGNGGRGGFHGYGSGGDGGGGAHFGSGFVRGGDGGDAGRPARPALGAVSTMVYSDPFWLSVPGIADKYGIPQPGKGGDSHVAYVEYEGYRYCLNILLRLISGPIPKMINRPDIIDIIDDIGVANGIQTPQDWWGLAMVKFPEETSLAMNHMRACER